MVFYYLLESNISDGITVYDYFLGVCVCDINLHPFTFCCFFKIFEPLFLRICFFVPSLTIVGKTFFVLSHRKSS